MPCRIRVDFEEDKEEPEDKRCRALKKPICLCVKALKPRLCRKIHGKKFIPIEDDEERNVIVLERAPNTTCTINLQGATITSWRLENEEQLFVGKLSDYGPHHPIRGGVSLAFPVCGQWSFGPRLGSTRKIRWRLFVGPEKLANGDVQAAFIVCDNAFTRSMWCNNFWVCFWVILQANALHLRYFIFNTNTVMPFECTPLVSASLRVGEVTECILSGLRGCDYKDDEHAIVYMQEEEDEITINRHMHRLYTGTPDISLEDSTTSRTINFIKEDPDVLVWNPWKGGDSTLCFYTQVHEEVNFEPDDHRHMLKIACGHVQKPVVLNPNEHFIGRMVIQVEKTKESLLMNIENKTRSSRVVPTIAKTKFAIQPSLPRFGKFLIPPMKFRGVISNYSEISFSDIPYLLAEEIVARAALTARDPTEEKKE